MRIYNATFLCILYCICRKTIETTHVWPQFAKILQRDTKLSQLLLLYNDLNRPEIFQVLKDISRTIPTRISDFTKMTKASNENLLLPVYQLEKTLIVISNGNDYGNSSELSNLLNSVAELSYPKSRPRILIVTQLTKRARHREFFQQLWFKQFLYVTILEFELQKDCHQMFARCFQPKTVNLHHYNPFTDKIYKRHFSKNSVFQEDVFPNKLRDMNGYKISVGFFHYPPYVYVNQNATGNVEIHGPDVNLMIFFSEMLNFTLEKRIYDLKTWPRISCTKEQNVDMLKELIDNDIDILGVQSAMIVTCYNKFSTTSKGTRMMNYIFLVPILPDEVQELTQWNFLQIMSIVCLFLMPWLISKCFKFDHRNWKLMYTVQIVLGFSIPKVPKKTVERSVFLLMMAFYCLQSSFIFSTLSSIQLQKTTFKEMETLDDVVSAKLTLITHRNQETDEERDVYRILRRTSIFSTESLEACAIRLVDYRNITCDGREDAVRLIIQQMRKTNRSGLKILREAYGIYPSVLYFSGGSPYGSRFELVISALIESGISGKWDATYMPKVSFRHSQVDLFKQESSLTFKSLRITILLLVVGHACAFLFFIAEIIVHWYLNR